MKYARLLVIPLIVLILFLGIIYKQHAESTIKGLAVHPSNFDLIVTPGEKTTKTVSVDNNTKEGLTISVKAENFTAQGEEGGVNLTEDATTYALSNWISVTPKTIDIPAGQSETFTFTITTPANAEPGGHFGSLIFATVPGSTLNSTGAVVSQQIASLILARVPGDVNEAAHIESFTSDRQFYQKGPATFDLRVRNTGVVHIVPKGEILITNMLGQKTEVPLIGRTVLPNSIRKMPTTWNQKFLIGKYTATLIAGYGSKNEQLTDETEFYAFPIQYGLIGLGILLIIILLRKRLSRALKAILTGK